MKVTVRALLMMALLVPGVAMAQVGGAGAAGGGFGQGGRGGGGQGGAAFDPTARQAQQLQTQIDAMKISMGATDEEWSILSDKIKRVMALQSQLNINSTRGGRGGRGGGGGGGGGFGGAPAVVDQTNPVAVASAALTVATQDSTAAAEAVKAKLAALRDARRKLQAELVQAQADLKGIVTVRQEAILVNTGILE